MIRRLHLLLASLLLLLCLAPAVPVLAVAGADDVFAKVCEDPEAKSKSPACQTTTTDPISGPNGIIIRAARIVALVTGVVAVIIIVIGGFTYVTSGGESNKITAAKNMIVYAAIGLVVVALAQAIVAFIISRV